VYESWEGTHNVLVAQVLADLHRMPIVEVVGDRLHKLCSANASPLADPLIAALDDALGRMRRSMTDAEFAARHFRAVLDRVVTIAGVASLLDGGETVAAEHLLRGVLGESADDDSRHGERVDELASAE
jgi:hypothetical protein